jgi:hypothetical protein
MSSTSVVIKCLEATKATNSAYGQITIGTLILQDCAVGVMFALMPAFAAMQMPAGGCGPACEGGAPQPQPMLLPMLPLLLLRTCCRLC